MSSAGAEFRRTTLWRLASAASAIVTSLLAYRLYNHYLGKALYGLVLTAVNIVGMLPQFDGGYRLAINRRMLADGPGPGHRRLVDFAQALYSRGALLAGGTGMLLLTLYGLGPQARHAGQPWTFYLTLGFMGALAVLGTAQMQLLVGLGRQRHLFALHTLGAWLYVGVLWIAFRSGQVQWAFPLAQGAVLTVPMVVAWWIARDTLPGLRLVDFRWGPESTRLFRQLWMDAAPAFVCQLVMLFLYAADSVMASQLLPNAAASEVVLAAGLFTMFRRLLQSADESIWPRLAAAAEGATEVSDALVRVNAVLYGVVMTVAAVTLPRFLAGYTPSLQPSVGVIWLFAARYLVTGLASQPAYYLYGHGRFGEIARHLGLEFAVAVVLSFLFAPRFGATGVAGAFALATLVGVAVPLPWAYAEAASLRPLVHLRAVWIRALGAMVVSGTVATLLLHAARGWPSVVLVGALATVISLGGFVALAAWRASRHGRVDARALVSHF